MASKRKLEVVIAGDAKGLKQTLGEVEGFGSRLSSKFKGLNLGTTLVGGLGVAAIGSQLTDALGEAREAEKIGRVTEQLVKQTGGAANLTADQVAGLSETISQKIGVDDDLIQSNANVLLSFKNVSNQVGSGNDVFTQAVGLANDMATVMGTDAKSATMQLGKALNNPTKGIAALSRAGVQFTQQQKDQIKALQESGDLLGAQKIILAEVSGEFGGAAEAAADPMDKLGVTIGNLKEKFGTLLIPIVDKAAQFFMEKLLPAGERIVAAVKQNWPQIQETITEAVDNVLEYVRPVIETLQALWRRFGGRILGYLRNAFENVKLVVTGALNVIRGVIDVVTGIITGKWGRVWDGIKRIVSGAWDIIKGVVQEALNRLGLILSIGLEAARTLIGKIWDGIVDYFSRLPGRIASAASGMFDGIKNAAKAVINWLIDAWNRLDFGIDISVPDWVPGVGGKGFKVDDIIPDIPRLAKGGIVTRPTLAVVGEAGPEAVVPLSRANAPFARQAVDGGVHLHFPNVIVLDQHAARQLGELIVRDRRNGGPISRALAGA